MTSQCPSFSEFLERQACFDITLNAETIEA